MGLLCWAGAPFRIVDEGRRSVGVAVFGLLSAASFGSMLQLGIGFGYLAVTHIDQAKNLMRGRRMFAIIPMPARGARRVLRASLS